MSFTTNNPRYAELNSKRTNLWNEYKEIADNTIKYLTPFIKENLGNDIDVINLTDGYCTLGFVSGTWDNGDPKYTDIEIYIGYDERKIYDMQNQNLPISEIYSIDNFRYQLNPFTGGSFDILPTNNDNDNYIRLRRYFEVTGKIISDTDFSTKFRNTLAYFCNQVIPVLIQRDEMWEEMHNIESEERKIQQEIETKKFNEELAEKISSGEYEYALIKKNTSNNNFTYRKAPVNVLGVFKNHHDAFMTKLQRERGYNPTGVKFQIIETSKLKSL